MKPKYADLTEEETVRATRGSDRLFVSKWHPAFDFIASIYEQTEDQDEVCSIVYDDLLIHITLALPFYVQLWCQ